MKTLSDYLVRPLYITRMVAAAILARSFGIDLTFDIGGSVPVLSDGHAVGRISGVLVGLVHHRVVAA